MKITTDAINKSNQKKEYHKNYADPSLNGITIEFKRNATIIKDRYGRTVGKSRCHPDDSFDINMGIMQALENYKKKNIQVGDLVIINSPNFRFYTYPYGSVWVKRNIRTEMDRIHYAYGHRMDKKEARLKYRVIHIAPLCENGTAMLAYIKNDYEIGYVVNLDILEKIDE